MPSIVWHPSEVSRGRPYFLLCYRDQVPIQRRKSCPKRPGRLPAVSLSGGNIHASVLGHCYTRVSALPVGEVQSPPSSLLPPGVTVQAQRHEQFPFPVHSKFPRDAEYTEVPGIR